jgi:peptide/nickel transport system permease protein
LPGDPALALAGEDADPQVIADLRQKFHLDEPIPVRYAFWAGGVLKGDLGESVRIQRPVTQLIVEKLPVTIQLAVMALAIALAIGISAGIASGGAQGHGLGLPRQHLRALGAFDAELLARHPA